MELPDKKTMYWILAVLGLGGSGTFVATTNPLYQVLDQRYVTQDAHLALESLKIEFDIRDELAEIQRRIDKGEETTGDLIRKAVLEDRLRRVTGESK